jgi:surfeit locus 1 family protein
VKPRGRQVWLFVAFALVGAAVFVRLGIWQLHRRTERRARNALITARLRSPEVDVNSVPRDTAEARFRRVRVAGTPDYDNELIYAARSYKGSPGVNLLTPVRFAGRDTAVIVDRGWVYAPDGATVDLAKWHDRDSTFTGYVEELPSSGGSTYAGRPRIIARMSLDVIRRALPYPVAPVYVVVLGDSAVAADRVARLSVPPLDDGPHMGYALQWFAFATIAVVGAGFVLSGRR